MKYNSSIVKVKKVGHKDTIELLHLSNVTH